jgi:hypothetical protein
MVHVPDGTAPGQPACTELELDAEVELEPVPDPDVEWELEVEAVVEPLVDSDPDVELLVPLDSLLDSEPVFDLLDAAPELDSDEVERVALPDPASLLLLVCALLEPPEAGASVPPSPTVVNVAPPHATSAPAAMERAKQVEAANR